MIAVRGCGPRRARARPWCRGARNPGTPPSCDAGAAHHDNQVTDAAVLAERPGSRRVRRLARPARRAHGSHEGASQARRAFDPEPTPDAGK